jgi:hypothetical protein
VFDGGAADRLESVMTSKRKHRHADMPPIAEGQRVARNPEMDAWQAAHEALVTIRVWLREDGRALTSTTWAADVAAAEPFEKPLEDMLTALVHINRNSAESALMLKRLMDSMDVLLEATDAKAAN